MLVGMTREVSVLVAVGRRVRTGVCELVTDGMVGIGIVAELVLDVMLAEGETLADAGAEGNTDRDSEGERVAEGAAEEDSNPDDTVPGADGDTDPEADRATEVDSVAEAVTVALLKIEPEEAVVSEAGMDAGMLRDSLGEMVALDDTPVPTRVDDGTMPEETSVPDSVKVGRTPEEADREALAEGVTLSVSVGIGAERLTELDTVAEGKTPDDRRPDEKSDAMLDAMLLRSEVGTGRGTDAVGKMEAVERADSALDSRLDTILGRAEPVGRSETADDKRLESSEITDGTTDGTMPEADGDAVIVADMGAVGSMDPELGIMPVGNKLPVGKASETTEDRNEGRSSPELADTPSEVGIAPDSEAWFVGVADAGADSVPSAVVIPMTIPLEGRPLEGRTPVGITPLLGRTPESTAEVGVGSAVPRREESKEPTNPADVVGCTISEEGG